MKPFARIFYGPIARSLGAPISVHVDATDALVLYPTAHYFIPRAAIGHCLGDGTEVSRVLAGLAATPIPQ